MAPSPVSIEGVFGKLEAYCRERDWTGFDPYDALNSELFARTIFAKSRLARIAFTQLLKRSPLNLRPWVGIQPQHDPKATALFVSAYVNRVRAGDTKSLETAAYLVGRLLDLRTPGWRPPAGGTAFRGRHGIG